MSKALKAKAFIRMLLIALLIFVILFSCSDITYATTNTNNFDKTNVLDDLQSSTINGKPFDIRRYPHTEFADIQIVTFVEYCYSYKANLQNNYGLYLYLWNPKGFEIDTNNMGNTINLATKYNNLVDGIQSGDSEPSEYNDIRLEFCNKSGGDYKNLFYKFKVVGATGLLKQLNSNGRRYDIGGVYMVKKGNTHATPYGIGGQYIYSGYAKGYGADSSAESNLTWVAKDTNIQELKVNGTVYRTESSSLGKDHYNQMNSVYFSVPNEIIKKYDKLQDVRAKWYDYRTAPIIVTSDSSIYNSVYSMLGRNIGDYSSSVNYDLVYNPVITYPGYTPPGAPPLPVLYNCDWSYNLNCYYSDTYIVKSKNKCHMIPFVFNSRGVDIKDYEVSGTEVADYIYAYDKSHDLGYVPVNAGKISADLFTDAKVGGKNKEATTMNIRADGKLNLLSYSDTHSNWDKLLDYGLLDTIFGKTPSDDGIPGIEAIHTVEDKDIAQDNKTISRQLLITEGDVDDFKDYYKVAKVKDETTFLMRYAVSDYFAGLVDYQANGGKVISEKAYMAQENVYLDFKIIQLGFMKDGEYIAVPVVSNPIDIVGGINYPGVPCDWWCRLLKFLKKILPIIAIILIIILLWPLLPFIISAVIWLIKLPFKLLGGLFKGLGKLFVKKDKKANKNSYNYSNEIDYEKVIKKQGYYQKRKT